MAVQGFDPSQNYADPTAPDSFPTGDDTGLWTTKTLAKIPVIVKHAEPYMPALKAAVPIAGVFGSLVGADEQREPMEATLQRFGQMSPGELAGLRVALEAGNFLTAKNPSDDDVFKAYKTAVMSAARHGQTVLETLQQALQQGGGEGAGRQRAPLTVTLTNPADIRKVGDTVAQNLLGRALSDQEANVIVAGFHAQESAAQKAAYGIGDGGGTSTAAPSPDTFAEQTLRAQHPVEVGGHDARRAVDEIFRLFSGGGG